MFPSIEVRWFGLGKVSGEIELWFEEHSIRDSIVEERTDRYLITNSADMGIKFRQGMIELKQRQQEKGLFAIDGSEGYAELWYKWSFPVSENADLQTLFVPEKKWIDIDKRRQLITVGVFDPKSTGHQIELSEIFCMEQKWWSVGVEVFGDEKQIEDYFFNLVNKRDFPSSGKLVQSNSMAYPQWLIKINSDNRK